ncbi:MAG TPA: radical SAM protein, partial [Myxococcota bacterium]|nr:radical SAM protein [Myxococcota bacterium]
MRILLINPGGSEDILTRVVREIPFLDSGAFFAPHALTAVAAVTPPEHEVRIHDENLHGPVDPLLADGRFDVVGITLTTNQLRRTLAIVDACRAAGSDARVVVGGIGAGTMQGPLHERVDTLFWGEVEDTWPRFLADMAAGRPRAVYEQVAKPDMADTPAPRWDLIGPDITRYCAVSVQTARGCPFDCAFCDVIYTYGRKVRVKPIDRVLDEVRTLQRLRAKMVMFADDNFAANRPYVKELLRRLVAMNNAFPLPLQFMTQLDITIAEDEELLELLADANFVQVQIGVESTSEASLKDMNKHQNLRGDIVQAVRRIQSYGIVVM